VYSDYVGKKCNNNLMKKTQDISKNIEKNIFLSAVDCVWLYGIEIRPLAQKLMSKMKTVELGYLSL
jgi:hypothetical protein